MNAREKSLAAAAAQSGPGDLAAISARLEARQAAWAQIVRDLEAAGRQPKMRIPKPPVILQPAADFLTIVSPQALEQVRDLALVEAARTQDMAILAGGLLTYGRLAFEHDVRIDSGVDHCAYLSSAIEAMAGNDLALVRRMLPQAYGLSHTGERLAKAGCNLLMALLYGDAAWKDQALAEGRGALEKKNVAFFAARTAFLMALVEGDGVAASMALDEAAASYLKTRLLFDVRSPFLKVFAPALHGLYNLARHLLPAEAFARAALPDHPAIWPDYVAYQQAHGFAPARPWPVFVGAVSPLNQVVA